MPWQNDARRRLAGRDPVHVSEPRRTLSRVASAVLVSAAVAVLSVPAAQSA
jgi:hypothetical protein